MNILKWILGTLGCLALIAAIAFLIKLTIDKGGQSEEEMAASQAAAISAAVEKAVEVFQPKVETETDKSATDEVAAENERLREELAQAKEAAKKAADEAVSEAIGKLREEFAKQSPPPAPAPVAATPVQNLPAGAPAPVVTLSEYTKGFKSVAPQEVYAPTYADFQRMNPKWSPPRHVQGIGEMSHLLVTVPGEPLPVNENGVQAIGRLWSGNDTPTMKIPEGFSRWVKDPDGHWGVVR